MFISMPCSSLRQRKCVLLYVFRFFLLCLLLSKICFTFSFLYQSLLCRPMSMTISPHEGAEPATLIIHQDAKRSWCRVCGHRGPHEAARSASEPSPPWTALCPPLSPSTRGLCTNIHDFCMCV